MRALSLLLPVVLAIAACAGSGSSSPPPEPPAVASCMKTIEGACSVASGCLEELPDIALVGVPGPVKDAIRDCPMHVSSQRDLLHEACVRIVQEGGEEVSTIARVLEEIPEDEVLACVDGIECSVETAIGVGTAIADLASNPSDPSGVLEALLGECASRLPPITGADGGTVSPGRDGGTMREQDAGTSATTDAGSRALDAGSTSGGYRLDATEFVLDEHGSTGGTEFSLQCASGEVVRGIVGRAGLRVDAIAPVCARLEPDGTLGSAHVLPSEGGGGGTAFDARCPGDTAVVVGLFGRAGGNLDSVGIACGSISTWVPDGRRGGAPDLGEYGGSIFSGDPYREMCPAGYVVTEIKGRSGSLIDRVGAICTRVVAD